MARLTLAEEAANSAQEREMDRSVAALAFWQGVAIRDALQLNRAGRFVEARRYLRKEMTLIKRYARGLEGVSGLLRELELLYEQVSGRMDERVMKDVYVARVKSWRGESDLRENPHGSIGDILGRS